MNIAGRPPRGDDHGPLAGGRKASFVLVASDQGTFIVNRLDWVPDRPGYAAGVGCEILEHSKYQKNELDLAAGLAELRHQYFGPGVVCIDGGANIGVYTVEWARTMTEFGQVVAFEPQERIFYALGGNICLNNVHNAFAVQAALGSKAEVVDMPVPDYTRPGSYGGIEVKPPPLGGMVGTGQEPYANFAPVQVMRIDDLALARVDIIKLDLEGMELEALEGAREKINEYRPILIVEHIKCGLEHVVQFCEGFDYECFQFVGNIVAVHRLDKCLDHVRHLHRELLRQWAGTADYDVEWVKFSRQQVETEAAE